MPSDSTILLRFDPSVDVLGRQGCVFGLLAACAAF